MTRLLSAALLAALILGALWYLPPAATIALATAASALAAAELAALVARVAGPMPVAFTAVASALVTLASAADWTAADPAHVDPAVAAVLALVVAAGAVSLTLGQPSAATLTRMAVLVMAPIYVGLPLGIIARVQGTLGAPATTWLIATVAISDSAQYYTGRRFGRRKLAPLLSPGKTVEGALGGLAAAAIAGAFIGPHAIAGLAWWGAAVLALLLAGFGMVGDLFESALKRSAGAKDSSQIIPGHGGVLDRVDAHLFAAPVFLLVLRYFVR
jgi:phosphatidate cytidylyltransferase